MPFQRARFLLATLVLLVGAGCVVDPSTSGLGSLRTSPDYSAAKHLWQTVAEGAARNAYDLNATSTVLVYRFSPDRFDIGLAMEDPPRRVSKWREDLPDARLVVNGAYFNTDGQPSGFLAIGGKRLGRSQFDLDKSGLVRVGSGFDMIDTARSPIDLNTVTNGFQSYPFFFIDGRPAITRDSGLRARRTFIGTDKEGFMYVGVLAHGEMSLYQFMRGLETVDIDWADVLNLDGGPSTGLAAHFEGGNETIDSLVSVPNVLVVREKRGE